LDVLRRTVPRRRRVRRGVGHLPLLLAVDRRAHDARGARRGR
jgi:hypothetical protein